MTSSFLPKAGEEASFPLGGASPTLAVRHGSSLSLMSTVCEFLANPDKEDTFNYIDPTADHHKWARKGLSLYYAAVITSDGTVVCALRAATEECKSRPSIFLIDYVYSAPSHRDQGIAGKLIAEVLRLASNHVKFVLSLEGSCVFWLERHRFFLCENPILGERLNVFPDTHLLIHQDSQKEVESLIKGLNHGAATASPTTTALPPPSFAQCLKDLEIVGTSQEGLPICLKTLATLLKNAKNDTNEDGKRQTIRINNPQVHRRVFATGGEPAMRLLQECGFELQVNEKGDAILRFAGDNLAWLDAAIVQLEQSA